MIHTLIFDFGNVVGFFDHQKAIDAIKPHTHLNSAEIRRRIYDGDIEVRYETGQIITDDFITEVLKLCEINCTPEFYHSAFVNIFTPNEEVTRLLPKLAQRYRLLLASNTNDAHFRHFRVQFAQTLKHFHFLGVSHEAQARKPTPAFYNYIQAQAGCEPQACLFIDDLPVNIAAATEFGWQTLLYDRTRPLQELLPGRGIDLD
jgi:glucose-1-phosphatase